MKTFIPAIQKERGLRKRRRNTTIDRSSFALPNAPGKLKTITLLAGMIMLFTLIVESAPSVKVVESGDVRFVRLEREPSDTNVWRLDFSTNNGAMWQPMALSRQSDGQVQNFPVQFKSATFKVSSGGFVLLIGNIDRIVESAKKGEWPQLARQPKAKVVSPKDKEKKKSDRRRPFIPAPPEPPK